MSSVISPRKSSKKKDKKKDKKSSRKHKDESKYAAREQEEVTSSTTRQDTPRKGKRSTKEKNRRAKTTLKANTSTHVYFYKVLRRGDNTFNQEEQEVQTMEIDIEATLSQLLDQIVAEDFEDELADWESEGDPLEQPIVLDPLAPTEEGKAPELPDCPSAPRIAQPPAPRIRLLRLGMAREVRVNVPMPEVVKKQIWSRYRRHWRQHVVAVETFKQKVAQAGQTPVLSNTSGAIAIDDQEAAVPLDPVVPDILPWDALGVTKDPTLKELYNEHGLGKRTDPGSGLTQLYAYDHVIW